ncbi:hypothetical protein CDD82_1929 [Ophiocordyceps australis]|uniref:Uncharacterized protein n=1 Tax=Ophiocordyceps australis TaxID=1399860 RepID=A0A2C5XHS3_9HYPO|nr:hypothetical protein CDD82_1929 [Ophiocordyceps australis]
MVMTIQLPLLPGPWSSSTTTYIHSFRAVLAVAFFQKLTPSVTLCTEHSSCAPVPVTLPLQSLFLILPPTFKMKFSAMIAGAFAVIASAAPTASPEVQTVALDKLAPSSLAVRGRFNAGSFNNFNFQQTDLRYLFSVNQFNVGLLQQLALQQNLDLALLLGGGGGFFGSNVFDLRSLLALQHVNTFLSIAQTGVFSGFDLGGLGGFGGFNVLNLGLLDQRLGGFDLASLIEPGLAPQLLSIANTVPPAVLL